MPGVWTGLALFVEVAVLGVGLFDLPDPHNLALSLSCAVPPEPLLGGGEGSAGGRTDDCWLTAL